MTWTVAVVAAVAVSFAVPRWVRVVGAGRSGPQCDQLLRDLHSMMISRWR